MADIKSINITLAIGDNHILIARGEPYRLVSLSGTEAASYDLGVEQYAAADGGYFTAARFEPREIELLFEVTDKGNSEAYRALLIKYLDQTKDGLLTITRGGITRSIGCRINGRPIFEQQNINRDKLRVSLSLICPDPWFMGENIVQDLRAAKGTLTFPFNSVAGYGITAGVIVAANTETLVNDGDGPVGCVVEILALGTITNPKITLVGGGAIELLETLAQNETLYVSTVARQKDVKINSVSTMKYNRASVFFSLPVGESTLQITAAAGAENAQTTITYAMKYLGI